MTAEWMGKEPRKGPRTGNHVGVIDGWRIQGRNGRKPLTRARVLRHDAVTGGQEPREMAEEE